MFTIYNQTNSLSCSEWCGRWCVKIKYDKSYGLRITHILFSTYLCVCTHVSSIVKSKDHTKKERKGGRGGEGCFAYRMWKSKEQWVVGVHQNFHPCQTCLGSWKNEKNDKAPQILPNQIPIDMLMSTQTTLPCKKRKNYHNPHTHHNIFLVPFSTSTHSYLLFHPQYPLSPFPWKDPLNPYHNTNRQQQIKSKNHFF